MSETTIYEWTDAGGTQWRARSNCDRAIQYKSRGWWWRSPDYGEYHAARELSRLAAALTEAERREGCTARALDELRDAHDLLLGDFEKVANERDRIAFLPIQREMVISELMAALGDARLYVQAVYTQVEISSEAQRRIQPTLDRIDAALARSTPSMPAADKGEE